MIKNFSHNIAAIIFIIIFMMGKSLLGQNVPEKVETNSPFSFQLTDTIGYMKDCEYYYQECIFHTGSDELNSDGQKFIKELTDFLNFDKRVSVEIRQRDFKQEDILNDDQFYDLYLLRNKALLENIINRGISMERFKVIQVSENELLSWAKLSMAFCDNNVKITALNNSFNLSDSLINPGMTYINNSINYFSLHRELKVVGEEIKDIAGFIEKNSKSVFDIRCFFIDKSEHVNLCNEASLWFIDTVRQNLKSLNIDSSQVYFALPSEGWFTNEKHFGYQTDRKGGFAECKNCLRMKVLHAPEGIVKNAFPKQWYNTKNIYLGDIKNPEMKSGCLYQFKGFEFIPDSVIVNDMDELDSLINVLRLYSGIKIELAVGCYLGDNFKILPSKTNQAIAYLDKKGIDRSRVLNYGNTWKKPYSLYYYGEEWDIEGYITINGNFVPEVLQIIIH
jgi:hypothetical protein